MATIINLNFLGTTEHRDNTHNIITRFNQVMEDEAVGNSQRIVRLFDGLGSAPKKNNNEHPTPGTYFYDVIQDKKQPVKPDISREIDDAFKRLTGTLVGDGVEHLLFEAVLFVGQQIKDKSQHDITVNLHGFSRGADTCVRLANLLDKLYPEVNVNLFLIDQVPGPTKIDDPDSYTIPANVKRIDSMLMLHEYVPGFESQSEDRYVFVAPNKTAVSIKHYFGHHSQGLKIREGQDTTQHVTKLLYDDMYRFCKETGSFSENASVPDYVFKTASTHKYLAIEKSDKQGLSPEKRFDLYCEMKDKEALYAKGTKMMVKDILKKYEKAKESALFVNQEHKQLFKQLYPVVFDWFFAGNSQKNTPEMVKTQLANLPTSFMSKFKTYFQYDLDQPLPKPLGINNTTEPAMGVPLIRNDVTYLKHSLQTIANYYLYHHSQKDSLNDSIVKMVVKILKNANTMSDKKAIIYIKEQLENLQLFYMKHGSDTNPMIIEQLRALIPKSSVYAEKVIATIKSYLDFFRKSEHFTLGQIEWISSVSRYIKTTSQDIHLSDKQKHTLIKKSIQTLKEYIDPVIHRKMANSFFTDEHVVNVMRSFPQRLERLSEQHFINKSMACIIIEKLDVYINRNTFWDRIQLIFKKINIPFPARFTPKKDELARNLKDSIMRLDKTGFGDDVEKISNEFKGIQLELNILYSEKKDLRIGTLDKIIKHGLGTLGFFQSIHSLPKTEENISNQVHSFHF